MEMEKDLIDDSVDFEEVGDENEEDLKELTPSQISNAVVWGTDWTTETIVLQLKKGNIDLQPSFQRRDAWSNVEKSKLIESLILGYPVPPIVLAESDKKKNSFIVIDGKQRLLSIAQFYSSYDENTFEPLKLRGLTTLTALSGKTYADMKEENSEFITDIDNQTIRTIVVKNWGNEAFLYSIFYRLNSVSKKLSPQELRQSLMSGEFLTHLDTETSKSEAFKSMLKNNKRMQDVELALRFYAYKYSLEHYKGNLKEFLDLTCKVLNEQWKTKEQIIRNDFSQLEDAITFTQKVFGEKAAFRRYKNDEVSNNFNRSVYELFTYYFSIDKIREAVKNTNELKEAFIALNKDDEFILSVDSTTKETKRVYIRFSKFFELIMNLSDIKDKGIKIPKMILNDGRLSIEEVVS